MAQRIRSCTNSTNFDTINCDSYLPRLLKREKPIAGNKQGCVQKCSRDRSVTNIGTSTAVLAPATPPNLKSRVGSNRQQNLQPAKIHKEVLSDNSALVEVTVRTHGSRRPRTGDSKSNRQPWGKLLKSAISNENLSSFSNFDPLRTLHFLAKELRSKVKAIATSDPNMLQMVSDMQQALSRIPPEIASSIRLQHEFENPSLRRSTSEIRGKNKKLLQHQVELPEKLVHVIKHHVDDKSCQTANSGSIFTESEIFQKQLEASTIKLEATCKEMEKLCSQLKSEKEEVELLLHAEKDTVKFLRKQIEELDIEKTETRNLALEKLAEERDNLQAQVKRLEAQINSRQVPPFRELNSLVQQLQKEKAAAEQENLTLRHKLTLRSMEKEKYVAILTVRDRQINEIRTEMNQLQEVVNEQLVELHKSSFVSSSPSQSSVIGNFTGISWQQMQANNNHNKETGDNLTPSSNNSEPPVHNVPKDVQLMHSFRELPSGDSSTSNLERVTSKMKKKVYESGISPPKVIKLFSSSKTTAGI